MLTQYLSAELYLLLCQSACPRQQVLDQMRNPVCHKV
jgi:hypothetical protein